MQRLRSQGLPLGTPADLQSVAEWCGAQVTTTSALAEEGVTWWEQGEPRILLRANAVSPQRARFTLAHELGHVITERFLHCHGDSPAGRSMERNQIERLCDEVAGALLLPQDLVLRVVGDAQPTLGQLRHLALRGNVSLSCAAVRLRRLGWPVKLLRLDLTHGVRAIATVGLRRDELQGLEFTPPAQARLQELPMQVEAEVGLDFACRPDGACRHSLTGTARRSQLTCVVLLHTVDRRPTDFTTSVCNAVFSAAS